MLSLNQPHPDPQGSSFSFLISCRTKLHIWLKNLSRPLLLLFLLPFLPSTEPIVSVVISSKTKINITQNQS